MDHHALEKIESLSFEIQYTVHSGFSSVYHWMEHDPVVQEAISQVKQSPDFAPILFDRFSRLLNGESRLGDASDWYIAALAYLYILGHIDQPSLAQMAVIKALAVADDFWLRRMAQKIADLTPSVQNS